MGLLFRERERKNNFQFADEFSFVARGDKQYVDQ